MAAGGRAGPQARPGAYAPANAAPAHRPRIVRASSCATSPASPPVSPAVSAALRISEVGLKTVYVEGTMILYLYIVDFWQMRGAFALFFALRMKIFELGEKILKREKALGIAY